MQGRTLCGVLDAIRSILLGPCGVVELWHTGGKRVYMSQAGVFGCRLSGPGCRQHSFAPAINFGIQKISSFFSKEGIWCLRFFCVCVDS